LKLSDYIVRFLVGQGVKHVFALTGGASIHMIDSLAKAQGIEYICPQHEQAGAMMADAYSRVSDKLGVAISTSGPGATNMITGVCCAYYDSVPVLYITGQVATFRLKGERGVRQLGFQETDTVNIFKNFTKYAVMVREPNRIRYELEKAVYVAQEGRPGPVVVDIPDDLQRKEINPDDLEPYVPEEKIQVNSSLDKKIDECIKLIQKAERPVVVLGWGVRLSRSAKEALQFIESLGFPVLLSYAMRDFIPADHPQLVGAFGSHGTRYGNFTIQNSDLVLAVGSRMDTRKSGLPTKEFARAAKKILVDIDESELNKFKSLGMDIELTIHADCKDFFERMNKRLYKIPLPDTSAWKKQIEEWKGRFPICDPRYFKEKGLNPYVFVSKLSESLREEDVIVSDTGFGLVWMMQAFRFKKDQRFFHAFNYTPMGYALPASIGACFASGKKRVLCITGDGGLQINLQELSTIIRHRLPIKIFLMNNHGYSMIMHTQDQWLNSKYEASNVEGGLGFPDFEKLALVYGFRTLTINHNAELAERLDEVVKFDDPVFCNVELSPDCRAIPQVKYGRPLEDGDPLLPRDIFLKNMIVKPSDISLE